MIQPLNGANGWETGFRGFIWRLINILREVSSLVLAESSKHNRATVVQKCSLCVVYQAKPESLHNLKRAIYRVLNTTSLNLKHVLIIVKTTAVYTHRRSFTQSLRGTKATSEVGIQPVPRKDVFKLRDQGLAGQYRCWKLLGSCMIKQQHFSYFLITTAVSSVLSNQPKH